MAALATKDEYQGLAAAVSLGITVLKRCKQNTWAELTAAMAEADPVVVKAFRVLDLSDTQLELIGAHQPELGLLRIAPPVSHVICPVCGQYILTGDTAPTRCLVTPGCSGKPAKIAAAVNAKKPVEESSDAVAAEPDDLPGLDELKANLDAAVETVDTLIANMVAETAAETKDAPPAARKPVIILDDDFD
jgi:hypothetical protein